MSRTDSVTTPDLEFGPDGLLTVVAQDAETREVLMVAHASADAIERTRETGLGHYYSRSRDELWQKGQSSGHVQHIEEIRVDCDGDAVLYLVDQEGGACHVGYESCFYRTLDGEVVAERVFDPDAVYE
ncbi:MULTISPECIES: phosphoribosyl-AMP cyclohydrolase [Halococcus]|uniref:phosphoribosyl-AMP cyclohydrolase n=1 Tax=Halococcus TaxID=2249 RepID=UPI000E70B439|nr:MULTISPECIES: phosphoribosyl-AMP cyclohydrolase [Halococcus]RJS97054.1 phosphoribosyl-AMP cyclohydrolase [Halococcus sp. IIIV-5B]